MTASEYTDMHSMGTDAAEGLLAEKELLKKLADANAFPLYFVPPLHLQEQLVNSLVKVKKFFLKTAPIASTDSVDWRTLDDCEAEWDNLYEKGGKRGAESEKTKGQTKENATTGTEERRNEQQQQQQQYDGGGQRNEDINHGKNEAILVTDEDVTAWLTVAGLWLDFWCSEQLEGYVRVQEVEKKRLKQILDKTNSELTLLLNEKNKKREQKSGDGGGSYEDNMNLSDPLPLMIPPEVLHTLPPLVFTTNPMSSLQTSCVIVAVFTSFPQLVSFIFDTILRISCRSARGDLGSGVSDEESLSDTTFGKNEFLRMSSAALETQQRKLYALLSSHRAFNDGSETCTRHTYTGTNTNTWHSPSSLCSPPDIDPQRNPEQTLLSKFKALTELENPFIVVNRYSSAWTEIGTMIKDLEDSIHPNLTIYTLDNNAREILRLVDEINKGKMKKRRMKQQNHGPKESGTAVADIGVHLHLGAHPPLRFDFFTYSIHYLRDISTSAMIKAKYPTFIRATANVPPHQEGGASDFLPPNLNLNSVSYPEAPQNDLIEGVMGFGDKKARKGSYPSFFSSSMRKSAASATMSFPTKDSSILDIIFNCAVSNEVERENDSRRHGGSFLLETNAPFTGQSFESNSSRQKRKGVSFADGEMTVENQLASVTKKIPEYLRRALLSTAVANTRRNTATATAFPPPPSSATATTSKPTSDPAEAKQKAAATFLPPSIAVSMQCSCVNYAIATAFLEKISYTENNDNNNNTNSTFISIPPSATMAEGSSPPHHRIFDPNTNHVISSDGPKRYRSPLSNSIITDVIAPLLQLQRERSRKEKSELNNNNNNNTNTTSNGNPNREPSFGEERNATDDHEQQVVEHHENETRDLSHDPFTFTEQLNFRLFGGVTHGGNRNAPEDNAINRILRERYISLPSPLLCFNLALLASTNCGTEQTLGTDAGYVNRGAGDAWAGLADYLRVVERRIDAYIFDNLSSAHNNNNKENDKSVQNQITPQTVLSSEEREATTRNMTIEYGSENATAADGRAKKSSFSMVEKSSNTLLLERIICDYNDINSQYSGEAAATRAAHHGALGREGTTHNADTCTSTGGSSLVGTSRRQYLLAMFPINSGVSFCTQPPAKDEVGTLVFGRFLTSQVSCRINSIRCDPVDPRHWNSLGVELGNALSFSSTASGNDETDHDPTDNHSTSAANGTGLASRPHTHTSFPSPSSSSSSSSPEALATTTQRRPPFIKVPIPSTHSCFAAYKKHNGLPKAIYPFYPASMGLDKILRVISDELASAKLFHHHPSLNMQRGVQHAVTPFSPSTSLSTSSSSSSLTNVLYHQIPLSPYAMAQQMLASPTSLCQVNPSSPTGAILSAAHPNSVLKALQLVAVEGLRSRFACNHHRHRTHHHDNPLHQQIIGLSVIDGKNNYNNTCVCEPETTHNYYHNSTTVTSFFTFLGAAGLAHCKQWSSPIDFRDRNLLKQRKKKNIKASRAEQIDKPSIAFPPPQDQSLAGRQPPDGATRTCDLEEEVVSRESEEEEGEAGEEEPFSIIGDASYSTHGTFFHSSGVQSNGELEDVEVSSDHWTSSTSASSSSLYLVSKQLCFVRAILLDEGFAAPWINVCDTIPTDEEAEILRCVLQRQVMNLKRKLKKRERSISTRGDEKYNKNKNSSNKSVGLTVGSEKEVSEKRDIYQQVEAIHGTQSMLHQRRGGRTSSERANSVREQEVGRRTIVSSVTPAASVRDAENRSEREGETSDEECEFAETNEGVTRRVVASDMDPDGDSFCVRRNVSRRAAATESPAATTSFTVGSSQVQAPRNNTSFFRENCGEEEEEEMESIYNLQRMHMAIDGVSALAASESQRRGVRIGSLVHTKKDCLVEAILRNPTNADVWNRLGYLLAEEEARVEAGIKIDIMREQELKREERRIEKNEKLLERRRRKATLAAESSSSRSSSASAPRSRTTSSQNTKNSDSNDARMRDTAIIPIDASPSDDQLAVSARSQRNPRMEEEGAEIEEETIQPDDSANAGDEKGTTIAAKKPASANFSEFDVTAVSAFKSISRLNTKSGGLCVTETLKRVSNIPPRVSLSANTTGKKPTNDNESLSSPASTSRACISSEVAREVASSPIFVIISTTAPISGEFGFGRRVQHIFTKEQCFALAVEFDPNDGNSWNNLGVSLVENDGGGVDDDDNDWRARRHGGVKIGTPRFIKDLRTEIDIAQKEINLLSQRHLLCRSTLTPNPTEKYLSTNLPLFSTDFLSALEKSYERSSVCRSYQSLTTELKNMLAMAEWNRHNSNSYLQVKKEREYTHARVRYSPLTLIVVGSPPLSTGGYPLDGPKEKKNPTTEDNSSNNNGGLRSTSTQPPSSSSIALDNVQQQPSDYVHRIMLKSYTAPLNSFSRIQCFVRAAHLGSDAARETLDELCNADEMRYQKASPRARRREGEKVKQNSGICAIM